MNKLLKTHTQTSVLRCCLNPIIKNTDCCYISEENGAIMYSLTRMRI